MEILEEKIREIMEKAGDYHAWIVCLMLAKELKDDDAANRFADKFADSKRWDIPLAERTAERLKEEKRKILEKYYN